MNDRPDQRSSLQDLLSKVSRYEALFELTGVINAAADIESVAQVLARRLKYIVDVYAWRYLCIDGELDDDRASQAIAIIVDGSRGSATVRRVSAAALSSLEAAAWRDRRTGILSGDAMRDALARLPTHLHKDDLQQLSISALVEHGETQALYLFGRRRHPFSELDLKCLSMVCGFFHAKVHTLWEQQKLRSLEQAYLRQEAMLRQSEKLATLGRLSAGMAHELNNPTAVTRHGAEQLRSVIARLEHARFALGAANLSDEQCALIAHLKKDAEARATKPSVLDPVTRSDLEDEVEEWLARKGVDAPWEHAPNLVAMGLCAAELEDLATHFDPTVAPIVIDYFGTQFAAYTVLEEIAHGAQRIAEIVRALKGYSHMDEAPVQSIDVRDGLNDTLVMLGSRLRDGIEVRLDYAEDIPRIQAYGSELNQVWTNLVDNAVGAMNGQGVLELQTYREADWVVVEVADSGPGIPLEAQAKVFDPFYTTKAPGEGTGLGLSISHAIVVEKHGGQISVRSAPGATRFTVKLPISEPSPPTPTPAAALRDSGLARGQP